MVQLKEACNSTLLMPTSYFLLVLKFCADRKKPKLKVGTHPIWESFFEANLADRDTTNSGSRSSILSIVDPGTLQFYFMALRSHLVFYEHNYFLNHIPVLNSIGSGLVSWW